MVLLAFLMALTVQSFVFQRLLGVLDILRASVLIIPWCPAFAISTTRSRKASGMRMFCPRRMIPSFVEFNFLNTPLYASNFFGKRCTSQLYLNNAFQRLFLSLQSPCEWEVLAVKHCSQYDLQCYINQKPLVIHGLTWISCSLDGFVGLS